MLEQIARCNQLLLSTLWFFITVWRAHIKYLEALEGQYTTIFGPGKSKFWHLLRGLTLWTIWIEFNDKVFNHEQWHEFKVKHKIWDELLIYAKAAWEHVLNQIKISVFFAVAMLQGFDRTCGVLGISFVGGITFALSGIGGEKSVNK